MIYDNSKVRRQDRLMDEERAKEILNTSEFGILSMIDNEGLPYAVPINFIWDNESSIYVHCAMEGKKLKALEHNPNISFCVVGNVHLIPNKFTTEYESVILRGKANINLTDEEKGKAINMILQRFSPNDLEVGMKYAAKSFPRTKIIRLDFTEFSGKRKRVMN